MSYKTERLVDLFPDAYAARDSETLLYKLLDAIGAEFMVADEGIKRLLKSHWVKYAEAGALDNLGAVYGVTRRTLRDGELEQDEDFRRRLQSIVPLFTGGGTRRAVIGAVRSSLGLPFDLNQLNLPSPTFDALRQDLEALVTLTEFSPQGDRILEKNFKAVDQNTAIELTLTAKADSVKESFPRIEWVFDKGTARRLSLKRFDSNKGVKSKDDFLVAAGQTLVLAADSKGQLNAFIDLTDVTNSFVNLDGTTPAMLPPVPPSRTDWVFRAQSGLYGDDQNVNSRFDVDSFDLPEFHVALTRLRLEHLTFEVQVPYFLEDAVGALVKRYDYRGTPFVFKGIPLERIQEVVDQTRAAGVRGSVQFYLTFLENHTLSDGLKIEGNFVQSEDQTMVDALLVANVNQQSETQEMTESLTLAGVFDISTFEGPFGFM
jgi:hypothetical protein